MDIRLNHKDITKAGTDSFDIKSVNNRFDSEFDRFDSIQRQADDKIKEDSQDIGDKVKNFRRKFLTRISKLVNKPSKVCFSSYSPRARDAFHRF